MEGKLTNTIREVIYRTVDNFLNESVDIKKFIEYYKERAEELQKHAGYGDSTTGDFLFELHNGKLFVAVDVLHSDTVTEGAQNIDDNHFIIKNSTVKKVFTMEPFNFDIDLFVPDVLYVMEQQGLKARIGLVKMGPKTMMLGLHLPGYITVNTYTGDSITAQLELKDIEKLLAENPQLVATTIDTFIVKMFQVIKALRKFYGQSERLTEIRLEPPVDNEIREDHENRVWKAWWMEPGGELHEVYKTPTYGHWAWAQAYCKQHGLNVEQASFELISRGWVRLTFNYYRDKVLHFDSKKGYPINEKTMMEIKNLAIELGALKITNDNTNKDIDLLQENMFPKEFNRHNLGTCMSASALATDYFLKKGIKNFKIVEGYVSMYPNQEEEDWSPHTWIQFDSGRIFDPTKNQWKQWGFDVKKTKYEKITKQYTPEEYVKICRADGSLTENMSYEELLKLTADTPRSPDDDTNRIDRSKNVRVRSIPISVESGLEQWNFKYKSDKFTGNPGDPLEGHIIFLKGEIDRNDDVAKLECKVDCSCPDYQYKFAYNNYAKGAGDIGPDSLNNAINRPPKQAYDIGEGLCKHLSALAKYLATKVTATKKQNIFEAIGDVARQGPFKIDYYD